MQKCLRKVICWCLLVWCFVIQWHSSIFLCGLSVPKAVESIVCISIPHESSSSWYHYSISDHICVSFSFSALILKSLENIFKRGPKKTFTLFLNIMCSQCVYTTPCYGKNQSTLFVIFPMNQKQQLCPDSEAASFDCVIAAWWRLSQFPFPGQWRIQQIDPSQPTQPRNS